MVVEGKGCVLLNCQLSNGTVSPLIIENVLFVPKLTLPLFSWKVARTKGYTLHDDGKILSIRKDNKLWLEALFDGPLPVIPEVEINDYAFTTYDFWHKAFCHSSPSTISKTEKLIQDSYVIPKLPSDFTCEACIVSKSTHKTPKPSSSRALEKGQYIHSDLCGPFATPSFGNALYYICFVDDATRYSSVQILKSKSEAAQATIDFLTILDTQYNCRVKSFRTDNGGEYCNATLSSFFAKKGIIHHLTPPYSPESNGVAERMNRSICEGIRAMLLPFKEKRLWTEAVKTFIYTKNRLSHGSVNGKTPYEAFHGHKPSITHLQPFGRECFVHIPVAKRLPGNKLHPKAQKGIFVGYTEVSHHYRIFVHEKRQIVISPDVIFPAFKPITDTTSTISHESNSLLESSINMTSELNSFTKRYEHQIQNSLHTDPCHTSSSSESQQSSSSASISLEPNITTSQSLPNTPAITIDMAINSRPKRTIRQRNFDDTITGEWWKTSRVHPQPDSSSSTSVINQESAMINILDDQEPRSYHEAKLSPVWGQWNAAFEAEMSSFKENCVWDVVPRPTGRKLLAVNGFVKLKEMPMVKFRDTKHDMLQKDILKFMA